VKKLLLEDLNVESFATTMSETRRGTVVANDNETWNEACGYSNYTDCLSCGSGCTDTEAVNCTGGGGGTSEGTLCGTQVNCSQNSCTGPYGCGCTKTESFDYTFCQTMCC
jgi:hypothetical protein